MALYLETTRLTTLLEARFAEISNLEQRLPRLLEECWQIQDELIRLLEKEAVR
jgi:hypothetical protein